MNVVFIHYHLKTGGVSTVIKQQLKAVENECRLLVLTGEPPPDDFPFDTITIKDLAYDHPGHPCPDPHTVAAAISQTIDTHFNGPCDIIHVHNPLLAKNRQLLSILNALKNRGYTLLLQVHDFAEDGRPLVYYADAYIADCHYAVINSRDYRYLRKAGLSAAGLHLLANSVTPFPAIAHKPRNRPRVVYPVRAIRRKNIGEALLISLFFEKGDRLAITLPPNSPADVSSYLGWKRFAKNLDLAVDFEVGLQTDFFDLLASARFVITTSITEGFGYSFLEPWLANNILWGRKLPDICRDFENHGMRLDSLYEHLLVPLEWIDLSVLYQRWHSCVCKTAGLYEQQIDSAEIEQAFNALVAKPFIDFGLFDETLQKQIIRRVLSHSSAAEQLRQLNPFLASPGYVSNSASIGRHNRQTVLAHYSQARLKQQLMSIYRRVTTTAVRQRIDKQQLLASFFDLRHFSLLKWCPYAESAHA